MLCSQRVYSSCCDRFLTNFKRFRNLDIFCQILMDSDEFSMDINGSLDGFQWILDWCRRILDMFFTIGFRNLFTGSVGSLILHYNGWRSVFVCFGILGLFWSVLVKFLILMDRIQHESTRGCGGAGACSKSKLFHPFYFIPKGIVSLLLSSHSVPLPGPSSLLLP